MITRNDVVTEARLWLGTPWKHQGRLQGIGTDCVGLVVGVAKALGIPIQDQDGYSENFPSPKQLLRGLESEMIALVHEPGPGDVVLMAVDEPIHLGILGHGLLIHVPHGKRVVEHHLGNGWAEKIYRAFAFSGVSWPH